MQTAENNYINILKESLKKKLCIMDEIMMVSNEQSSLLGEKEIDFERFDGCIAQKDELISQMQTLDNGFQTVYDRVQETLKNNKGLYLKQIEEMQKLIRQITEKSMDIQATERRNKEEFQQKLMFARKEKKTAKAANHVAASYYQNMNRLGAVESQFLDQKK